VTPERLSALKLVRVAVIGDVMVDEYVDGHVERISPEAPVPVVRSGLTRSVAGGAANAAANVAALGAHAVLVGLVGRDGPDEFARLMKSHGRVEMGGLVVDAGRRTTRKTRVLSQRQQLVRLDSEDLHPLSETVEAELCAAAAGASAECDIVILSDYGKGVLTDRTLRAAIEAAKAAGRRVVVDPKRTDFSAYRGADIVTPNRSELSRASGLPTETDAQVEQAAHKIADQFGGALLVTRSEQGMSFFDGRRPALHVPTVAREVFDVSGAGDTVVATLATALAAGFDIAEAILLANHAAGLVVAKAGTATVSFNELGDAIDLGAYAVAGPAPVLGREEAERWRNHWGRQGLTVGFTNGCFDLLHPGHVSLIRQSAAACDRLIVALNSDASVRRLKGPRRPVQSESARAEVMSALKGVALVTIFEEDTPREIIEALRPDLIVKGADYKLEDVVGADLVQARGGKVLLVDLVSGHSTTKLIAQSSRS
jgi:D-beta-D-heptose 7-phosphate kinase/D-beta-D-heptose 1-phosphate adenosyltransferase